MKLRALSSLAVLCGWGCIREEPKPVPATPAVAESEPSPEDRSRARMVDVLRDAYDIRSPAVLAAMRLVPRHLFVPDHMRPHAYVDDPLPIGHEQTISQPFMVARMTELLEVGAGDKVLEIGTGSGYQAAVLDALGCEVYTIEIVEPLGNAAAARLAELGYVRTHVRIGDGYRGWPEQAPFDAIIVTAAPEHVPAPLVEQLAVGGHLVIPVGPQYRVQTLRRLTKNEDGVTDEQLFGCTFVPMTGEARDGPPDD